MVFLCYANQESDDVINSSSKTVKHRIRTSLKLLEWQQKFTSSSVAATSLLINKRFNWKQWTLEFITLFTNYLITESEVVTGKSQTEALLYWPSDSEVNTVGRGLRFSRNDRTVEVIKDVRANCFCASLLRTQIHMPRHPWARALTHKINKW